MKNLLISGGSKGIGIAIVEKFLSRDFNVFNLSRTKPKGLKSDNLYHLKCNLNKENEIKLIRKELVKKKIKFDVIINNAGKSGWMPIQKVNSKFLLDMFNINLFSSIYITKYFVNSLRKNACILNISSLAGKRGTKNNSIYCAAKFGINGFTQSLAKELGSKKIRVNAICPVLIQTPGLKTALNQNFSPAKKNLNKFFINFKKEQSPLNELPEAIDVANLAYFLTTKEARYINGQCINLDCGILPS